MEVAFLYLVRSLLEKIVKKQQATLLNLEDLRPTISRMAQAGFISVDLRSSTEKPLSASGSFWTQEGLKWHCLLVFLVGGGSGFPTSATIVKSNAVELSCTKRVIGKG